MVPQVGLQATTYYLASSANSMLFGALLFVGVVDCRTLLTLKDTNSIKSFFSVWWPCGATLMIPLGLSGVGFNALSFYFSKNNQWLIPTAMNSCTLLFTGLVMGEDIKSMMDASISDFAVKLNRFAKLHVVRIVFAATAVYFGNKALIQSTLL